MALNPETLPSEVTSVFLDRGTTTGNGTGIDITDFIGKLLVNVDTAATTLTFSVETSDVVGSGYVAFDPAITVGTGAGLTSLTVDTRKAKQFIRLVRAGTANGAFSAVVVGKKQDKA
jgi:hypothetical protein